MRYITLAIAFLICTAADAQIIRAEPFYIAPEEGVTLLLDAYPGAAVAYSLRKLDKDYTGSAIRVRRSSDNTEQDIGFLASGFLDTAAMKTFVGANNGFVVTWYNQADSSGVFGLRNATQSTAANQPQIIKSGVVVRKVGDVAIEIASTNGTGFVRLQTAAFASAISQPVTVFTAFNNDTNNDRQAIYDGRSNQFAFYYLISAYEQASGVAFSFADSTVGQKITYNLHNTTSSEFSINNASPTTGSNGTNTLDGLSLGNLRGTPNPLLDTYQLVGQLHEVVVYPSNQSSNRSGIQTNINSFYSIY